MFHWIKRHDSLGKRIFLLAFTIISLSLLLTGSILAWNFDKSQERSLNTYLGAYIDTLLAATNVNSGEIKIKDSVGIFDSMPFYWQITSGNKQLKKSITLKEWLEPKEFVDKTIYKIHLNEQDANIIIVKRTVTFPSNIVISYILGIPEDTATALLKEEKQKFTLVLLVILTLLAFFMISIIAVLQILAITKPLNKIKQGISDIHNGRKQKLEDGFPKEISLLANEINNLIGYGIAIIDRHRTFAANLSHTLKTPLTIINNAAQKKEKGLPELVLEKSADMLGIIDRNLSRVSAIAVSPNLFTNIDIAALIEKTSSSFSKLYNKKLELKLNEQIFLKGNEADFYEILGNIIENAFKYSTSLVAISVLNDAGKLSVIIEDDGPGIPENEINNVLSYGKRLDTNKPGYGVGLAVANDIIALYTGKLILNKSELDGLKVQLIFPAAT